MDITPAVLIPNPVNNMIIIIYANFGNVVLKCAVKGLKL